MCIPSKIKVISLFADKIMALQTIHLKLFLYKNKIFGLIMQIIY